MKILENIESIRKEKGVKQAVIAEALGVKQPAYSNYITRSDDIYYNRLSQIANVLGISVVDIITYPEKYVSETESCEKCREKDDIIKNLNEYIKVLTKKK
jgi:transcriptional regulator with XRE-family HTH domain